jgi:hypothetical protein
MKTSSNPRIDDRIFKVWEYQVSHGQLLIRSPKSPATGESPERLTNIDLVCLGVEYLALPRIIRGLELTSATPQELRDLASVLGRPLDAESVRILLSAGKRFPVVAATFSLSENDWDIFESPFEFRSQFRGSTT